MLNPIREHGEITPEYRELLKRLPLINDKFRLRYIEQKKDFKTGTIEGHTVFIEQYGQVFRYYMVNEFSAVEVRRIVQFLNGTLQYTFNETSLSPDGTALQDAIMENREALT